MSIQVGKVELSTADRIAFFQTLSSWLSSGAGHTSVADAVRNTCDAFSEDEYRTLKPKMDLIVREFTSGQTPLYQTLRIAKLGFVPRELAIVEAAEKSNQLTQALPSLVQALKIQHEGNKKLFNSMAMPLGVGFMLILMSLGVLLFMLPMVLGPVVERRPEAVNKFPFILQQYWYASLWLRAYYQVPIAVAATPFVLFLLRSIDPFKRWFSQFFLWFKPTRRLILGFNGVIAVFFLPALARSGMTSAQVLDALADCMTHPALKNHFRVAAQDHQSGTRLGQAVKGIPFPSSFANAVNTGEQTGQIAERVEELREPYRQMMDRAINQTVGALKFFVMALLLPFFIVSTYTSLVGPIFALMEY